MNDFWKFNGTHWTWISGSSSLSVYGTYGQKGVPGPANTPGGRERAASWIDSENNFYIFGGKGCDSWSSCKDIYEQSMFIHS